MSVCLRPGLEAKRTSVVNQCVKAERAKICLTGTGHVYFDELVGQERD